MLHKIWQNGHTTDNLGHESELFSLDISSNKLHCLAVAGYYAVSAVLLFKYLQVHFHRPNA